MANYQPKPLPGRDPWLVWYTQKDRILSEEELDLSLAHLLYDKRRMLKESEMFWRGVTKEKRRQANRLTSHMEADGMPDARSTL